MDYRKKLIVKPGSKVRLADYDPAYHGKHASEQHALQDLAHYKQKMTEMQRLLYGDRSRALLIVLQGIDAAGKDGTCWHVIGGMNPQGVKVTGFKAPTAEDLLHDFLWRIHPHAPAKGEVAILNRSHYEDVLIVRVHKFAPKNEWSQRYELINQFEHLLVDQNDTTIIKFFLSISKDEQLARFKQRLDDPARNWKISDADYKERDYWDEYIAVYEDMLNRCSTRHAPWYVIPANHKWFRNLAISQIIADTMEDMKLQLPKPAVDLDQVRKEYHTALQEEKTTQHNKTKKKKKV